nr:MAG TPA: helix-turn-helix domain protein [Caudoviricetes sp.]
MTVLDKMNRLGMTQVEMIRELRKRGYEIQPPMMSSILTGVYTYPKAKKILETCEEIVNEREKP